AAATGARHHHDAAVQREEVSHLPLFVRTTYGTLHIAEHYSAVIIRSSRPGWTLSHVLSGLAALANVECHVAARQPVSSGIHTCPRRGLATGARCRTEPSLRRQRSAHRPRRADLCSASDRQ